MNEPTDLDIRIAALQQEHISHVGQMSARAAQLASELASTKARLESAEKRIAELEKQPIRSETVTQAALAATT